mmetsp:Transcript_9922/g.37419  ORF Transcript_9922/g.37419 Transcript_9922/m.37419 type:complete len:298 (+) Transcript_9922:1869-2762(+)
MEQLPPEVLSNVGFLRNPPREQRIRLLNLAQHEELVEQLGAPVVHADASGRRTRALLFHLWHAEVVPAGPDRFGGPTRQVKLHHRGCLEKDVQVLVLFPAKASVEDVLALRSFLGRRGEIGDELGPEPKSAPPKAKLLRLASDKLLVLLEQVPQRSRARLDVSSDDHRRQTEHRGVRGGRLVERLLRIREGRSPELLGLVAVVARLGGRVQSPQRHSLLPVSANHDPASIAPSVRGHEGALVFQLHLCRGPAGLGHLSADILTGRQRRRELLPRPVPQEMLVGHLAPISETEDHSLV